MGKAKRKAEKAARSVLGVEAAKQLKPSKKQQAAEKNAEEKQEKSNASIPKSAARSEPPWKNREKPLVLCARGITFRYRHLMTDLMQLIPHHKTDSKLDTKHDWNVINEVAELKGATTAMFFEARKKKDLYMWLSNIPTGPCARFLCTNVHTMAELKLSGNHLKGSRPVLSFDAAFDEQPQLQVVKELLQQVFVTPRGHQKSKPFFDHVILFSYCDNRIWLRNYQVVTPAEQKELRAEGATLVEVGPRVTLQLIKVFAGSFRGKVLFENPEFINPNAVRSYEKRKAAGVYERRKAREQQSKDHKEGLKVPVDGLSNKAVFAPEEQEEDAGRERVKALGTDVLAAAGDVLALGQASDEDDSVDAGGFPSEDEDEEMMGDEEDDSENDGSAGDDVLNQLDVDSEIESEELEEDEEEGLEEGDVENGSKGRSARGGAVALKPHKNPLVGGLKPQKEAVRNALNGSLKSSRRKKGRR